MTALVVVIVAVAPACFRQGWPADTFSAALFFFLGAVSMEKAVLLLSAGDIDPAELCDSLQPVQADGRARAAGDTGAEARPRVAEACSLASAGQRHLISLSFSPHRAGAIVQPPQEKKREAREQRDVLDKLCRRKVRPTAPQLHHGIPAAFRLTTP